MKWMDRFTEQLIKKRKVVFIFSVLVLLAGFMTIPLTRVNYDLSEYLPQSSPTREGILKLQEEFSYPGMAEVMVEDLTVAQAVELKQKILEVDGVLNVLWLDDVTDITVPAEMMPQEILHHYYKDSAALFRVEFLENDYSLKTGAALEDIRMLLAPYESYITGTASDSADVRGIVADEFIGILLVILPVCLLILLAASVSWIEPVLYLLVIGISIILNMSTNFLFPNVSFITHSMAAVLQLAISLDYSLFLFHRYIEEKNDGKTDVKAIVNAVRQSLSTVSASALTTVAGFCALLLMRYRIGADIGLVLGKGIAFSFITVMILMPVMIYSFRRVIEKTRHRSWMPSLAGLGKFTVKNRRYLLIAGAVILAVSFTAQQNTSYLYGDASANPQQERLKTDRELIADRFGVYHPLILLVPKGNVASEISLTEKLSTNASIREVQALVTVVDPFIPPEILPESLTRMFVSESYVRIIVLLNTDRESPEMFEAVRFVRETANDYFPDQWVLAGKASSISDIRDSVESDSGWVLAVSLAAVFAIILFSSRSLIIPVLLVTVIQGSIWLNMSIPTFQGKSLVFIGYIIISALQLGATIDYAILISSRYMESRQTSSPVQAACLALTKGGAAVMVSALILSAAGFAEGILSDIPSVSEIGILLGRGAALSAIMVLFVLPGLLVVFDKLIMKTTLNVKTIE